MDKGSGVFYYAVGLDGIVFESFALEMYDGVKKPVDLVVEYAGESVGTAAEGTEIGYRQVCVVLPLVMVIGVKEEFHVVHYMLEYPRQGDMLVVVVA